MKKNENNRNDAREFEINIIPLLKEILKRIWLIALVGLVVGGAVFAGAKVFVKPTYRSGFTAYVNNKQGKENSDYLTSSDVTASKQLVLTYQKILTSNTILTASAKSIDIDSSYESLSKKVSTEVKDETEIISVYVVDKDPEFAYKYAQAISQTSPQYMAQIVEGSSMKIIDYPEYSEKRYKPNYTKYGLLGFVIGALLVVIWVVVRFLTDDTVKAENDIESRFSIPILGVIPDIAKAGATGSDYYEYGYYAQPPENEQKSEQKNEQKNQ